MPFIELGKDFKDVKETPLAPEAEYDLKCLEVEEPAGKDYIQVTISFENADYRNFNHFLNLPNKEKDAKTDEEKNREPGTTRKNKMLFLKRFLVAFKVPFDNNGFNPKDILGCTTRCGVGQDVNQKGMRNQVLALPPLPEEG